MQKPPQEGWNRYANERCEERQVEKVEVGFGPPKREAKGLLIIRDVDMGYGRTPGRAASKRFAISERSGAMKYDS
jgi:hypothetical protein